VADITDPPIIRFSNEYLRPMAESLVRASALLDDFNEKWVSQVLPYASGAAPSDVVVDGRLPSGVTELTVADWTAFKVVAQDLADTLNTAGVSATITKPTVRPLQIG